jgi:hypothetical protein
MTSRYEGKPLLRLLECYVLDTIGELSPSDRRNLEQSLRRNVVKSSCPRTLHG